jgi:hypothetical protein
MEGTRRSQEVFPAPEQASGGLLAPLSPENQAFVCSENSSPYPPLWWFAPIVPASFIENPEGIDGRDGAQIEGRTLVAQVVAPPDDLPGDGAEGASPRVVIIARAR